MARKILLADDSVTAQNMGRKILADAGYEVITVNNGSAALKKINEQRPDLIVLDVYMPGYSGLEVCQRLKDAGDTARIPILLTVGKLEPFKPEEARRARADGFIVKPFEASELLSALSKLEDKVVPRGETSKTGRFARATAAIEDNRFDKSVSAEHDSGWKTRIVFPKKHKEEPVEPEADDPSIYNPVNKDLRTVAENKAVEQAPAPRAQEAAPVPAPTPGGAPKKEEQVDLGALAPAGLPKDVTPEEIAALAAAAAQIKGKLEEEKAPQLPTEMAVVAPVHQHEAPKEEVKLEAPIAEPVASPAADVTAPAVPAATFAERAEPEKLSETEGKEKELEVAANPAVVPAAQTVAAPSEPANSGSESWPSAAPAKSDEPVTIAAAAAAHSSTSPRWTAVAVALAPEEDGVSLEQEMQRMYSAYAAAESDRTAIFRIPEIPAPKAEIAGPPVAPIEASAPVAATPAPAVPTPAEAVPEAAETMNAVASAATDAITAAVAELESVAAAYVAEKAASAPIEEPSKSEAPAPAPVVSESTETKSESVDAKQEPASVREASTSVSDAGTPAQEERPQEVAAHEVPSPDVKAEEIKEPAPAVEAEVVKPEASQAVIEEPVNREAKEGPVSQEAKAEESKDLAPAVEAPALEAPAAEAAVEDIEKHTVADEGSEEPAMPARREFRAGGMDDMAKRESETAAAWATWRKIRETGTKPAPGSSSGENEELSEAKDAAMAVAAGAERSPEDAESLDSDPEIASIVDSVLADMRPRIVEEIARKLGKKK